VASHATGEAIGRAVPCRMSRLGFSVGSRQTPSPRAVEPLGGSGAALQTHRALKETAERMYDAAMFGQQSSGVDYGSGSRPAENQ
jgi:hypothetical protein